MSTPTFTEVLRSDRADARRYSRYRVLPTVEVRPLTGDEDAGLGPCPCLALLHDLSLTGLCFISPVRLAVNTLVSVQVKPGAGTLTLRGFVRRSRRKQVLGRVCYAHGVEFIQCESVAAALPEIAKYLYLAAGLETPFA